MSKIISGLLSVPLSMWDKDYLSRIDGKPLAHRIVLDEGLTVYKLYLRKDGTIDIYKFVGHSLEFVNKLKDEKLVKLYQQISSK